jgi:hypothetical protein
MRYFCSCWLEMLHKMLWNLVICSWWIDCNRSSIMFVLVILISISVSCCFYSVYSICISSFIFIVWIASGSFSLWLLMILMNELYCCTWILVLELMRSLLSYINVDICDNYFWFKRVTILYYYVTIIYLNRLK